MIANIASDDALILPHHANPAGLNFRERQVIRAFGAHCQEPTFRELYSTRLIHCVISAPPRIVPAGNSPYLTGMTIGWPFSATRKSMALARAVVLGFRMVCTLLLGLEPKSPA